jgi:ATP-dependent RNA helicase DeaD
MTSFNNYNISEPVKRSLDKMGFTQPTPIQELAIPVALKGRDLVGQAPTGTGKTVAFGVPIVEACDKDQKQVQALVITPTRELAVQVAQELNKIGDLKGIRSIPVYGGQDVHVQIHGLKSSPQVIVGTPGRLMDHIFRIKTIGTDGIRIVVLDEADKLLEMGFLDDTKAILRKMPAGCQIMLFSATMPEPVVELTRTFMKEPAMIGLKDRKVSVPEIAQYYTEVQEDRKFDALVRLLIVQSPDVAIIFGKTKKRVAELYEALSRKGYSVRGLHGDMEQPERDSIMKMFKDGGIRMLVSTDVASRGLDISGVTHIYNFDVPEDPESYVHRIGRTGRAGKSGIAVTFVTPLEKKVLKNLEQYAGQRILPLDVPTDQAAVDAQKRMTGENILAAVGSKERMEYADLAESLLKNNDPAAVLSAALSLMIKEPDLRPVELTGMPPGKAKSEEKLVKERGKVIKDRTRGRKYPRR